MQLISELSSANQEQAIELLTKYLKLKEERESISAAIQKEIPNAQEGPTPLINQLIQSINDTGIELSSTVQKCKEIGIRVLDCAVSVPVVPFIDIELLRSTLLDAAGKESLRADIPSPDGSIASQYIMITEDVISEVTSSLLNIGYMQSDLTLFDQNNPPNSQLIVGLLSKKSIDEFKRYINGVN